MGDQHASVQPLSDWLQVARAIESAIEGLTEDDLDSRGGPNGWSIRETVHHLVESNLVACTIVIAAVGKGGCTYDWSWLNPDRAWMERMGYSRGTVAPAIEVLSALCRYVAALLSAGPDALRREIKLLDAPGTDPYPITVEQVIRLEVEHARQHLLEVDDTLKQRPR
jgi:DinB superfamily